MIQNDAEIAVKRDEIYADGARSLRWNVFRPAESSGLAPAVLLYHGGGWRVGDRASMTAAATEFARFGYVAIAPEYRLWRGALAGSAHRCEGRHRPYGRMPAR